MEIRIIETDKHKIAVVKSKSVVIENGQDALDFFATIGYDHGTRSIALNKAAITENFFDLTTGVAGDVAQKFVNYDVKFAVYGDFTGYTSKALKDYMYECNSRGPIFFAKDENEAVEKLEN